MGNLIGIMQQPVPPASAAEVAHQPPPAIEPSERRQPANLGRTSPVLTGLAALSLRSETPATVAPSLSWADLNLDMQEAVLQKLGTSIGLPAFKPLRLTNKQFSEAGALLIKGAEVTAVGDINAMATLFKKAKNIRTLRVEDKKNFGDKELAQLVEVLGERGVQIEELDLRGCNQITDAGLGHLTGMIALQTLNLDGDWTITDAGLRHLASLTALQTLDLHDCRRITDAGLGHLTGLTALQTLDLTGCNEITDAGLGHLTGLTALQTLNLAGCSKNHRCRAWSLHRPDRTADVDFGSLP